MTESTTLDLFAGGTHASHSAMPGSEQARQMTAISGRKCIELLQISGRDGSLPKMLLGTSTWASTTCYLTWKPRTTPGGRLLFQLAPSMPSTAEIESGLLPTPRAMEIRNSDSHLAERTQPHRKGPGGLTSFVQWEEQGRPVMPSPRKMMPTPTAQDHIERKSTSSEKLNPLTGKSVTLDRFVKFWPDEETQMSGVPRLWPTPSANDNRDRGNLSTPAVQRRKEKGKQIMLSMSVSHNSGQLNPTWVEWLQGFPLGWTIVEDD